MHRKKILIVLLVILMPVLEGPVQAEEKDTDDIIVEKNLFSPDRKKWVMEKPSGKKPGKPQKTKKELSKIELYGTVVSDNQSYAVLRTKKGDKRKDVYMVGDYISGHFIKEIDQRKVVLTDESGNEDFIIYINEGKKNRTAAKTEIREEVPVSRTKEKAARKAKKKTSSKSQKSKTSGFLKKRLKRDLNVLKSKKSKMVERQAQKDYKKIEKLLPQMTDQERREVLELKKELDSMIE